LAWAHEDLTSHGDPAPVDLVPRQSAELASTQPGGEGESPDRAEPIGLGHLEESAGPLRPSTRSWRSSRPWQADSTAPATLVRTYPRAGIPALEDGSALESIMANDPGYQTAAEEFGQRPKPDFSAELLEEGQRRQLAEPAIKERKKNR
jgi:hypothetical protein